MCATRAGEVDDSWPLNRPKTIHNCIGIDYRNNWELSCRRPLFRELLPGRSLHEKRLGSR